LTFVKQLLLLLCVSLALILDFQRTGAVLNACLTYGHISLAYMIVLRNYSANVDEICGLTVEHGG